MSFERYFGPLLSIAQLSQSGLFQEGHCGTVGFQYEDFKYIVEKVGHGQLNFIIDRKTVITSQYVNLGRIKLKLGIRRYFVCPQDHKRCNTLYLCEEGLVSYKYLTRMVITPSLERAKHSRIQRSLDRLTGTALKGPARGAVREKFVAKLKSDIWIRAVAPDRAKALDDVLARSKLKGMRVLLHSAGNDLLSAETGFAAGIKVRVSTDAVFSADSFQRYGSSHPRRQRAMTRAFVEDFPYLTVGDLRHQKLLRPGLLLARSLDWSENVRLIVECHLFDVDNAFVLVRSRFADRPPQLIRLVQAAGPIGWYFMCPFTAKRCSKLFYRDGLFGSAIGNMLIHRSQRKVG